MDIHKWLDETVLPVRPPSSPNVPAQSSPVPFRPPRPSDTLLNKGRRRKRSTSDSSLLHVRTAAGGASPMRRPADAVEGGDGGTTCSDADGPDSSSESGMSGQRYARKPRRKTRPERYGPAPKDDKRHQKGESRKSKKRSRRKTAEKQGAGLVQSFHAKNVPQDRLTLKPREKLGLFNKGRVSSPVKGRGLPDLVFSEMKFLQKQRSQPEAVLEAGLPKRKRRKDHADTKQDEISAYFTTVRPTLAEKDVNTQAREGAIRKSLSRGGSAGRGRLSRPDNAIPTVEPLNTAPGLGSGSRSMRHDSGSYVSWSESVRAPSAAPMRLRAGSTMTGQLGSTQPEESRFEVGGGDMLHSRTPPSAFRHFRNGSGERFLVSSSTRANHRDCRSHSVPQHNGSACLSALKEGSKGQDAIERTVSAPLMPAGTPFSLEVSPDTREGPVTKRTLEPGVDRHSSRRREPVVQQSDIEDGRTMSSVAANGDPLTSSTLGRLLRECNSAFDEQRAQVSVSAGPGREHARPPLAATVGREQHLSETGLRGNIRSLPTVRFSGVEAHRPIVPNYSGLSIYEEQEKRDQAKRWRLEEEVEEYCTWKGVPSIKNRVNVTGALDGRDYGFEEAEWRGSGEGAVATGLGPELCMEDTPGTYGADDDAAALGGEDDVVASGFWRPNKLY